MKKKQDALRKKLDICRNCYYFDDYVHFGKQLYGCNLMEDEYDENVLWKVSHGCGRLVEPEQFEKERINRHCPYRAEYMIMEWNRK